MIFASFDYLFTRPSSGGNTNQEVTIDLDFRSLYQIDPNRKVVLGYASISAMRRDVAGSSIQGAADISARLIGNFNETFNVLAVVNVPRTGEILVSFNGIAFNQGAPFVAPPNSQILMPPTFQIEFEPTGPFQTGNGDTFRVMFSIGYDLQMVKVI